ncbi:hypothetical protein Syun_015484 [Stephania yunnanensis]|uniref:non-specific serine/threonine protein kinase n=1 Tax=Stephania yunnanensis TaxID=152371 RepID=A0AAP0JLM0_9MAGN
MSISIEGSVDERTRCSEGVVSEQQQVSQWKSLLEAIKRKSFRRVSTFPLSSSSSSEITKRSLNRRLARLRKGEQDCRIEPFVPKPSWRNFDHEELANATDNFSSVNEEDYTEYLLVLKDRHIRSRNFKEKDHNLEKLIGKGGHAEVYKGCLSNGQLIAVKRLMKKQNEEERTGDFLSELGIIAHIDHPNAARLLGFGVEGGLHLVLQFSPHGSLASLLHGSGEALDWSIRFRVALGVAEGLNYLHQGCQRRIIHRDIKASNILLTENFEPQISDFGLAKWLPEQWAHHIVFPIEGTFGYLSPEYFMHGIVDEKTDVFAFGVLLLELITGRRAVDSRRQSLVMWAKPLLDANNMKELVDPRLGHSAIDGKDGSTDNTGSENESLEAKAVILGACELEDYTSSKYLHDLNRHRQLALE